jgi:C-terminal processing protease CtpA/Prc
MRLLIAYCAVGACLCLAQDRSRLPGLLNFEEVSAFDARGGWNAPAGDVFLEEQVVHGGKRAVRVERKAGSSGAFSTVNYVVPLDFAGTVVALRGWVKTEEVSQFAGLWMREDGETPGNSVAFDSMQKLGIKGTTDWTQYTISVPVRPEGRQIYIGFLLSGTGKAWADDLELLVDGKPVAEAPKVERPRTILETDHEFDGGSKVSVTELSPAQIANLATLGRVWGFLKYHHPKVTAGAVHWDYELFRVMPQVLKAEDRAAGNAAIGKWVASLGPVPACEPCAAPPSKETTHLAADLAWIRDEALLGAELSRALQGIHEKRSAGRQFFVSKVTGVGNPEFKNEPAYGRARFPDAGYQLLGLFRYWNMIQYWFPYRDLIGEDWGKALSDSIPKFALAGSSDDYKREFLKLIARVHDTHANLWSSLAVRPPVGNCQVPAIFRFVEDRAVVAGFFSADGPERSHLMRGDVIDAIDGKAVADLVQEWTPYYAASNRPTALRDMGRNLTQGPCGEVKLRVVRDGETVEVASARVSDRPASQDGVSRHDIPGDAFRLLSKDVAYIKISELKRADVRKDIESAMGTKGLILDIRNYPSDFPIFQLGSHLVEKPTPFVRFTSGDLSNPGAFLYSEKVSLDAGGPHYAGRVVVLVDEVSQSSAEYHSMAFRAAPNAIVIGSTTAGADGNVSQIPLPGGLSTMISGIAVLYPDDRPTQRVGIVPDREVRPTIAGIRAGRDEVLEAAIREILGAGAAEAEVRGTASAGRGN